MQALVLGEDLGLPKQKKGNVEGRDSDLCLHGSIPSCCLIQCTAPTLARRDSQSIILLATRKPPVASHLTHESKPKS